MGQQQILYIALSFIIVTIVLVVGVNYFSSQASSANRDALSKDLYLIAGFAEQYYKKTVEQGGGGKSYLGFKISEVLKNNINGKYSIIYSHKDRVLFEGVGTEEVDNKLVTVQLIVRPTTSVLQIIN